MKRAFYSIIGILLFCGSFAQEIPQKISYQGKLLENGDPVTGTKSMIFTIGSWNESHTVMVNQGLYSVTLGASNPIPTDLFNNNSTAKLQITVEGSLLSPQTDILSVPYAYKAEKTVDAEKIAGRTVSTNTPSTNQVLKWNGSQWLPNNDNDNQTLSISGSNLTITGGNTISLPSGSSLWSQSGSSIYYNSGNVGIGTSNPYGVFEVYSSSDVNEYRTAGSSTGTARTWYSSGSVGMGNSWNVGIRGDLNKGYAIESHSGGVWAPRLFITQGGDVGIGTTTPDPGLRLSSYTSTNGDAAIGGYATGTSGSGVVGHSTNGYAGVHGIGDGANYGVYYSGGLGGSGSKVCVIRTSKGPTEMYCVESPEIWFEDFGSGKLINGHTKIELNSDFLETVTINNNQRMKVFIQLRDNCNGIYVKPGVTGFDVYELNDGKSNAEFDYRIVAKRKGYEHQRMKVVENGYLDRFLYPDDNDSAIPSVWKEKRSRIKR